MIGKRSATQYGFMNPPPPESKSRTDRLLRRINELIDFEPVRVMVAPHFAETGRPSIDPVLMIKMMIAGYLLAIPSDRQLVEECADRISVRRFLGLGLTDPVPAHSSFTHWRQRLGTAFFRSLLHEVVGQCQSHGMMLSGDRTVDATAVKAQADRNGPVVEVPEGWDVDEYLRQLAAGDPPPDDEPPDPPDDAPPPGARGKTTPVNLHDPDARLSRKPNEIAQYRFFASFCADAHNGLITDAIAFAREKATTAVEHVIHDIGPVRRLVADGLYDDGGALAQLYWLGVEAFVPKTKRPDGQLSRDEFAYDPELDVFICPEGKKLRYYRYNKATGQSRYISRKSDCDGCPIKAQCTTSTRRTVSRQDNEWARELTVRAGPAYELLQRCRRINEHLNLLAKRDHCMARARGLGLDAMCIQATMTGLTINLRKLVQFDDDRQGIGGLMRAVLALLIAQIALWRRQMASAAARYWRRSNVANQFAAALAAA